jgi:hypothetical protein
MTLVIARKSVVAVDAIRGRSACYIKAKTKARGEDVIETSE